MTNAVYPKYKQHCLEATLAGASVVSGDLKVVLVDTADYTYAPTHEFFSDVPALSRIKISTELQNQTFTNGLMDADNITLASVSGDQSEALILFLDTGVEGTSRLVLYLDTGITNAPVTPNGGDIDINWNSSGIFQL